MSTENRQPGQMARQDMDETIEKRVNRGLRVALIVGLIATGLLVLGAILNLSRFFQSYLMAYVFWVSLSLGCLAVLMLHHLTGGPWGFPIQRLLVAGARTMPLMALLFLPILLGIGHLFEWSHTEVVQADEILRQKALYLNVPFFVVRAIIYFAAWLVLSFVITRNNYRLDETGDVRLARRMQRFSGPGLIVYVLTVTFASVDWIMSLEPHWVSSIFGLILVSGQVLAAYSLGIALLSLVYRRAPFADLLAPRVVNDLENLLLAALLSWVYLSFMQFLIIWWANIPEEAAWYVHRTSKGWEWVALAIVLLQFVVPFGLMLANQGRWRVPHLAALATLLLVMHLVAHYWLVIPSFSPDALSVHWLDLVAPLAIGGFWFALFAYELGRHRLVPERHPKYIELVEREKYETASHAS